MESASGDSCPVCNKPYTNQRMVECTKCLKWCHYECVNVTDAVAEDENWTCPLCRVELQARNSISQGHPNVSRQTVHSSTSIFSHSKESRNSSSSISSKTKLRLQYIQEEKELMRKEREFLSQERQLARESRRILEEDDTASHQDISDQEIYEVDSLANEMLSLKIERLMKDRNGSLLNLPPNKNVLVETPFGEPVKDLNKISCQLPEEKQLYGSRSNSYCLTHQQHAARRSLSNELPIFYGNPYDWPIFISNFERSTNMCGFDNNENLMRLQKCLRGAARNSVSSFLILPECVPQIISTLKILYGRPEQIIDAHINQIRRQPPPKVEKLETLVEFSLAIKNLCVSLQAAKLDEYLNNPSLMHELLDKLPPQIKVNWALHRATLRNFKGLTDFADWIYHMGVNVCTALPKLSPFEQGKQSYRNERTNIHEFGESGNQEHPRCKICNEDCRNAAMCPEFRKLSMQKKWEVVRDSKLCKLCLKRHQFPCKYPVKCNKNNCNKKHHPFLHQDEESHGIHQSSAEIHETPEIAEIPTEFSMTQVGSKDVRFRIIPVILSNSGKQIKTYAFLDEGSSVTLINKTLAEKLNLKGNKEQLCLKWTGNQKRLEHNSEKVVLSIQGDYEGAKQFDHRVVRTVETLSLPEQSVEVEHLKEKYLHLRKLPLKSYKNQSPQILIGLDNWDLAIPIQVKEGRRGEPLAAKCRLGWSVFALLPSDSEESYSYHICQCNNDDQITNHELFNAVKLYFSIESLGVQNLNSIASKELERARYIQENTFKQEGTQYQIGLLWKYDYIKLPDSKNMALQRLECIEKKIKHNPELGLKMNEHIRSLVDKNYVRKLKDEELAKTHDKIWYLPIFPVFNPNKPDKFRVVWDAAAKVQGVSLNSVILKGDDQLTSLLGVLLRFRKKRIGFSADIKEMFLRIGIIEKDQHCQRFFWRDGNAENHLETYIMTVMTFGAACSPSNAQYVKNTNAEKFNSQYPRAVECIQRNHYVDDLLDSMDTEDEAIEIAKQVAMIHRKGNFDIRNWRSNSQNVMKIMNNSSNEGKVDMNFDVESEKCTEKVLGMWWNLKSDEFIFSLKFNKGNNDVLHGKRKPTKREILRILMSVYDPLGLLSHFMIYLKIFLQELWRSKISWDEPITDTQFSKWMAWLKHLPKIEEIKIPRCYLTKLRNWNNTFVQLHIFVDASEHASATVAYLRIQNKDSQECECTLLGAKTHVAPLKLQTIPRLELDSAVMGARFAKSLCQHLSITVDDIIYWSDSLIVLSWIRNEDLRKLNKYVAYRLAEIQENSIISSWRYVPTKLNVADDATKWTSPPKLHPSERWFTGPSFLLLDEKSWPSDSSNIQLKDIGQEISVSEKVLMNHNIEKPFIDLERFSKYTRLLRSMAQVYRAHNTFLSLIGSYKKLTGIITSEELDSANKFLIRMVQMQFYSDEIGQLKKNKNSKLETVVDRKSSVYKLSPYLDEDEILRIRGRLDSANCLDFNAKRPIILPRDTRLTFLIVQNYHEMYLHQNHESVVNDIRQKYHIPKLRRVLQNIRKVCQTCHVRFTEPKEPEMSPLPECRLAVYTAPFTYTGVDYFGPINVKIGRRIEKRWGVLFTCLTIRAIHLEIAYKLNSDSCIMCFTNFMNRRGRPEGRPRHIYCDRGTNFIATERILRQELQNIDVKLIANSFVHPEMKFHFNYPLSPHMGGAWERLVKSVKLCLYAALPSRNPDDELLRSCLMSAENIVNSRPLTYISLESENAEALTPNHFLLGSSNGDKPIGQLDDESEVLKCNYLCKEQFANKYWKRFVTEYIPQLLLRKKWHKQIDPVKEGDVVIICDRTFPRCNWPKGRIIEVKKSADGQVRKAKVQTSSGIYERPVVKLAIIPVEK